VIARITPLRRQGKRAYRPDRPAGSGRCTWCQVWFANLEWDHVLPRSLFPGPLRDHRLNRVPSCRPCNRDRASGKLKPSFQLLTKRSQEFCLAQWLPGRLERHFADVPTDGSLSK